MACYIKFDRIKMQQYILMKDLRKNIVILVRKLFIALVPWDVIPQKPKQHVFFWTLTEIVNVNV